MSGVVPAGAIADANGNPTQPMKEFMRSVSTATGGQAYEIQIERVSDTAIRFRLKGADGVWRASPNITLS